MTKEEAKAAIQGEWAEYLSLHGVLDLNEHEKWITRCQKIIEDVVQEREMLLKEILQILAEEKTDANSIIRIEEALEEFKSEIDERACNPVCLVVEDNE